MITFTVVQVRDVANGPLVFIYSPFNDVDDRKYSFCIENIIGFSVYFLIKIVLKVEPQRKFHKIKLICISFQNGLGRNAET